MTTWVNAGTVTVTNGSTTVTGVGTDWVGPGVQSGYAFVGPAGDIYEIVEIVSDTSLTIAPAYRGSTASGQPYAIAPTRGVVQALIDRTTSLLTYLGDTFDWKAPDGTVALPGIAFAADTNTGFLRPGADQIGASTGGTQRWLLSDTGMSLTVPALAADGTAAAPSLSFSADTDTGFLRPAADQIGASTGGVQRWLLSDTAMSLTVPALAADGTAAEPSLSFSADTDTGFLHPAADQIGASTGGVQRWLLSTTALTLSLPLLAADGTAAAPSLSFSADPDTGLYRVGADQIGMAAGGVQRVALSTTALTSSLPVLAPAGTAAAPSFAFSNNSNMGLFRVANNVLGFSTNGAVRARIDGSGRLVVGSNEALDVSGVATLQNHGSSVRLGLHRFNAGASFGAIIAFSHSRSNTIGEVVSLNSGDAIGQIQFFGASTGGAYAMGADITASVAETPSGGDMPTHLRFRTTPVGGTTPTERVRITAAGQVGIGTASPTAPLHVAGAVRVGSFTVATVPSASGMGAGAIIYVSNETDGAVLAFSDGTNWRRVTDRAIIS
jgi:hypothetical protein